MTLNIDALIQKLKVFPFYLVGDKIKERKDHFRSLRRAMRQARVPMSYEMYISNTIFYSAVAGITGAIIGLILAYLVVYIVGLPPQLTRLTFTQETAWLLAFREIFIAFVIVVFLTGLFGGIAYMLFLGVPSLNAGSRKGEIDRNLPYAVTFMYALSRSGMNIIEILRSISACTDTYGEAAKEIDVILRDMDYFGNDLRTALHNVCEITPSDNFKDLMHNLLTVIDSGGDIPAYFRDKSEQILIKSKVEQKGFLETLALLAESYVTAFVAGPLFIIILGVMMSVMGSGDTMMITAIIYMVIPVGSMMFVVMIGLITPGVTGEAPLLPTEKLVGNIVVPDNEEKDKYLKFIKSRKSLQMKEYIKDPSKFMREKPIYSMIITVPIALIYLGNSIYTGLNETDFLSYIDDKIIFTVVIIIVPLIFFHEYKQRRESRIQAMMPDFLRKLASTNETGMTLKASIKLMTRSDEGLSKDIKDIWNDIDWGVSINEALRRFANRVKTPIVARSITLLTKANESSGDIGEVLTVAARDAAAEEELKRERSMAMFIYVVIIYISFMTFVGIIYVLSTTFLEQMAQAGEAASDTGGRAIPLSLNRETLGMYNRMFFHGAIIQGFSSGLIAGVMGEGNVLSGLKHSLIMLTIGYFLFVLFVL